MGEYPSVTWPMALPGCDVMLRSPVDGPLTNIRAITIKYQRGDLTSIALICLEYRY